MENSFENRGFEVLEASCRAFEVGQMTREELRGVRVPLGIYEQRELGRFMVRARCPAGIVSPVQLRQVAAIAESRRAERVHITTRQDLQLHGLELRVAVPTLHQLLDAGLETLGSGGNTVRNLTASH